MKKILFALLYAPIYTIPFLGINLVSAMQVEHKPLEDTESKCLDTLFKTDTAELDSDNKEVKDQFNAMLKNAYTNLSKIVEYAKNGDKQNAAKEWLQNNTHRLRKLYDLATASISDSIRAKYKFIGCHDNNDEEGAAKEFAELLHNAEGTGAIKEGVLASKESGDRNAAEVAKWCEERAKAVNATITENKLQYDVQNKLLSQLGGFLGAVQHKDDAAKKGKDPKQHRNTTKDEITKSSLIPLSMYYMSAMKKDTQDSLTQWFKAFNEAITSKYLEKAAKADKDAHHALKAGKAILQVIEEFIDVDMKLASSKNPEALNPEAGKFLDLPDASSPEGKLAEAVLKSLDAISASDLTKPTSAEKDKKGETVVAASGAESNKFFEVIATAIADNCKVENKAEFVTQFANQKDDQLNLVKYLFNGLKLAIDAESKISEDAVKEISGKLNNDSFKKDVWLKAFKEAVANIVGKYGCVWAKNYHDVAKAAENGDVANLKYNTVVFDQIMQMKENIKYWENYCKVANSILTDFSNPRARNASAPSPQVAAVIMAKFNEDVQNIQFDHDRFKGSANTLDEEMKKDCENNSTSSTICEAKYRLAKNARIFNFLRDQARYHRNIAGAYVNAVKWYLENNVLKVGPKQMPINDKAAKLIYDGIALAKTNHLGGRPAPRNPNLYLFQFNEKVMEKLSANGVIKAAAPVEVYKKFEPKSASHQDLTNALVSALQVSSAGVNQDTKESVKKSVMNFFSEDVGSNFTDFKNKFEATKTKCDDIKKDVEKEQPEKWTKSFDDFADKKFMLNILSNAKKAKHAFGDNWVSEIFSSNSSSNAEQAAKFVSENLDDAFKLCNELYQAVKNKLITIKDKKLKQEVISELEKLRVFVSEEEKK